MGLGNVIKNLMGSKEEKKEFKAPDVTFLEEDNPSAVTHTMPIKVEPPEQQYIIKHDNEYLVYNSLDDMPPEIREEIERLDQVDDITHTYSVIVDGERKTYSSIDEIPEDIRASLNMT